MSVILDVLKKLDREKPSRRDLPPNIATEILRPDLPRSKRRIPLNIITVSLTAIVTAAITYVLMKEVGFLSKPSPPVPPSPPGPSQQVEPAPLELSIQKKSSPPASVSPPVPSQQIAPAPPESKVSGETKVSVESKPITAPPDEKKTSQSVISEKKDVVPTGPSKKSLETPVTEPAKSLPSLTISAIVWYEDPSMRFAIVNGLKAVEGSLIEGVKVVEINRTSVRFLYNHQHFEISILR